VNVNNMTCWQRKPRDPRKYGSAKQQARSREIDAQLKSEQSNLRYPAEVLILGTPTEVARFWDAFDRHVIKKDFKTPAASLDHLQTTHAPQDTGEGPPNAEHVLADLTTELYHMSSLNASASSDDVPRDVDLLAIS
jgi:hypothetical protein